MARATFVKKARKDILGYDGEVKIAKGESYWWWKFRFGGKNTSKTRPKRSQLTQSAFYGTLYDLEDGLSDIKVDCVEDMQSEIDSIRGQLEELRDQCEESRSNMPDALQESDTGELLQTRYDTLDEIINEFDSLDLDYEEPDEEELRQEARDELSYSEDEKDFTDEQRDGVNDIVDRLKSEHFDAWVSEKLDEFPALDCE